MPSLFEPVQAGDLRLANRIAMAPLTRNRAPDAIPTPLMATYYTQRASAGLLITEATAISPQGQGYADVPGLYGTEQLDGWKRVTHAVHAEGGKIVMQLWHMGRIVHPVFLDGQPPVSASATTAPGEAHTPTGKQPYAEARAMTHEDIQRTIADYRRAAENAKKAGFDGVQLHGANGYLVDQFLRDGTNLRTDEYGGSPENRTRFMREVLEALIDSDCFDRIHVSLDTPDVLEATPRMQAWTAAGTTIFVAARGNLADSGIAAVEEIDNPLPLVITTGDNALHTPELVRDFQSVIGKEARAQMLSRINRLPDLLVAAIGGGSNAIGLFHPFLDDKDVEMLGIEAAGHGLEKEHAASLAGGRPGILHGNKTYLLQDEDGQIAEAHSISAGLDYPGVGPEHAWLKDSGRAEYVAVTDDEALEAFHKLCRLEGIIPALESSHALAYAAKIAPRMRKDQILLVNLSGRGDKDMHTVAEKSGLKF